MVVAHLLFDKTGARRAEIVIDKGFKSFLMFVHSLGIHNHIKVECGIGLLQECAKEAIQSIEIETDAKTIVQMINKETRTDASLEDIINDIWNLAQSFQNATFMYAHQKCNHAAHVVASYVSKGWFGIAVL
ncbi:hypothetical protein DVH24_030929 [Malus domestica]|uniref:RNase H type-1 domain-containing protein n=1 Tax=Malus domestica TaxID=3750 RepID=A0A498HAX1_MALDO|nr:hypothetical protein DVH24_030929 [Malus domestica]